MGTQRKTLFVLLTGTLFILCSFLQSPDKASATVQQVKGVYLFFLSSPASKYEVLGTLSVGTTWSGSPEQLVNSFLKQAKKEYSNYDGIIIKDLDCKSCDVIRFK